MSEFRFNPSEFQGPSPGKVAAEAEDAGVAGKPRLRVALWVFATLQGEGSARQLERLTRHHLAYQWLCGGVSVNHHLLSDFRSQGGDKWDELLTQIVASLMAENLVKLQRVAQDGMKVRASAGKSSFRRKARLEECLAEAREQVAALRQLAEENPEELTRRQQAARERAGRADRRSDPAVRRIAARARAGREKAWQ